MNNQEIARSIRSIANAASRANRTMPDADLIAIALRDLARRILRNEPYQKWSFDFTA